MPITGLQLLLHYATDIRDIEVAGESVTVGVVSAAVKPKPPIFFDVFECTEDDMFIVFSDKVPKRWHECLALYLAERALRTRLFGMCSMATALAANPDAVDEKDRQEYADFWRSYLDALLDSMPGSGTLDRSIVEEI